MARMSEDLRYPVGRYARVPAPTEAQRQAGLDTIAALPVQLTDAVAGLDDAQLDTPYRPGGWTVRQVVHHIPDSHVNAYIRMKLAATEDRPPIKTYEEKAWADQPEARSGAIEMSLALVTALHVRWTAWLRSVDETTLARAGRHPDWGDVTIDELIQLYAWHCRHHVAHITALRARQGW
jgi:uncharacterized damage-inducible protein DinB